MDNVYNDNVVNGFKVWSIAILRGNTMIMHIHSCLSLDSIQLHGIMLRSIVFCKGVMTPHL